MPSVTVGHDPNDVLHCPTLRHMLEPRPTPLLAKQCNWDGRFVSGGWGAVTPGTGMGALRQVGGEQCAWALGWALCVRWVRSSDSGRCTMFCEGLPGRPLKSTWRIAGHGKTILFTVVALFAAMSRHLHRLALGREVCCACTNMHCDSMSLQACTCRPLLSMLPFAPQSPAHAHTCP